MESIDITVDEIYIYMHIYISTVLHMYGRTAPIALHRYDFSSNTQILGGYLVTCSHRVRIGLLHSTTWHKMPAIRVPAGLGGLYLWQRKSRRNNAPSPPQKGA